MAHRIQVVARLRPEPLATRDAASIVTVDAEKRTLSVPVRKSAAQREKAASGRAAIDHSADGWAFSLDAILDQHASQAEVRRA